ncbi:MAG: Dabb family protein [Desulfuromonadales bacterium]|nr:Dabb family protein [Desulfuromonadales bacterium]
MLTHIVLFKFKAEASEAQISKLCTDLQSLPEQIDEIGEFRCGRDVIRSERSYDLGLIATFADRDALQRYQVHPDHQQVVAQVREIAASVVAVDFED